MNDDVTAASLPVSFSVCDFSAQHLRIIDALLRFSPDVIMVNDRDSRFLYVSVTAADVIGADPEAILGKTPKELGFPPELSLRLEDRWDQVFSTGRPVADEFSVDTARGIRCFECTFSPVADGDGDLCAVLCIARDATQRIESQREQQQLAAIVASSQDAIIGKDPDGLITSWNSAAERIFGYTAREVIGRPITRLCPLDRLHEEAAILRRIRDGERTEPFETVRRRKGGALIDVAVSVSPIRDADSNIAGASTIIRDITAQRKAQTQLQRQFVWLAALRDIDRTITAQDDLYLTLGQILDQARSTLKVDAVDILTVNLELNVLQYAIARGFHGAHVSPSPISFADGPAGRAAREQRIITRRDLPDQGADYLHSTWLADEGFTDYYAVPLIAHGELRGVLELFHRDTLEADQEWLQFLENLAGQTAIAIETAILIGDLKLANREMVRAYDAAIEGWSSALDLRDKETEGHSQRVTELSVRLAQAMGLVEEEVIQIRRGALLHDVGKLGVPDAILLKPGPLTDEEWEMMRRHPEMAYEMLYSLAFLRPALAIPYCHHEKWDGTGYPNGIKGDAIPLQARIFAIVDVWDSLCSERPYREAWPTDKVRDHIQSLSGTHFDPAVVDAFFQLEQVYR